MKVAQIVPALSLSSSGAMDFIVYVAGNGSVPLRKESCYLHRRMKSRAIGHPKFAYLSAGGRSLAEMYLRASVAEILLTIQASER
jgi:hypothetical protein